MSCRTYQSAPAVIAQSNATTANQYSSRDIGFQTPNLPESLTFSATIRVIHAASQAASP